MSNSIKELFTLLDKTDYRIIAHTHRVWIQMGSAVVPTLVELLTTGSYRQVANTVMVLGEIGDLCSLPALIDLLFTHPNHHVRHDINVALQRLSYSQAVEG